MARRGDPRQGQETPPARDEERAIEFPKEPVATGVRPEMVEVGQQVVAKRRRLLERLAAYDRGEDPGS